MPVGPKKGMFESKAKFAKRRAAEAASAAAQINKPPSNEVDTKGRPLDPKRVPFHGIRGYDASKEPQKQAVAVKREWSIEPDMAASRAVRQGAEAQLAAKGVSAAEFKAELGKLSKSSSKYEEQRKELFARRQLGKRAGK